MDWVRGDLIALSHNTRGGNRPPVEQILYQFEDSCTYFLTINGVKPIGLRLDIYIHQTSNLELADQRRLSRDATLP
jgi:hypothetical protein